MLCVNSSNCPVKCCEEMPWLTLHLCGMSEPAKAHHSSECSVAYPALFWFDAPSRAAGDTTVQPPEAPLIPVLPAGPQSRDNQQETFPATVRKRT